MSLQSLKDLRMSGHKPSGVVHIVFSDKPLQIDDSPALVVIRSTDEPQFMDLRPLVGLPVALYSRSADADQFLRLLDVLESLKCKFFGAVTQDFVLPMLKGATPRHAELLTQSWKSLCQ
jgi:hypothetical protein